MRAKMINFPGTGHCRDEDNDGTWILQDGEPIIWISDLDDAGERCRISVSDLFAMKLAGDIQEWLCEVLDADVVIHGNGI